MLGYQVRSVNAEPSSKPAVIAETQLADQLAEEHSSSHGPPVSLLDQAVVGVTSARLVIDGDLIVSASQP